MTFIYCFIYFERGYKIFSRTVNLLSLDNMLEIKKLRVFFREFFESFFFCLRLYFENLLLHMEIFFCAKYLKKFRRGYLQTNRFTDRQNNRITFRNFHHTFLHIIGISKFYFSSYFFKT